MPQNVTNSFYDSLSPEDVVIPQELTVDWECEVEYYRINGMPDSLAKYLDEKMVTLDVAAKHCYAQRMRILRMFRDDRLYESLASRVTGATYRSFAQWVEERVPFSHSEVYKAIQAAENLDGTVPFRELETMQREQIHKLAELPEEVRKDPELRAAAVQGKSRSAITEMAKRKYPDQHLESIWPLKINWTETVRKDFEEAFKLAQQLDPDMVSPEVYLQSLFTNDLQLMRGQIADATASTGEPPDLVM
jgi:hypothetical protein